MANSSIRKKTTEAKPPLSKQNDSDDTGPTVSAFRRYYPTK